MSEALDTELLLRDVPGLSQEDLALVAQSIEAFGVGPHPVPDPDSLPFFKVAYARECVAKASRESGADNGTLDSLANRLLAAITESG